MKNEGLMTFIFGGAVTQKTQDFEEQPEQEEEEEEGRKLKLSLGSFRNHVVRR